MEIKQTPSSPSSDRFLYILTFFAAIGGFLFGYDTGVVSGAMILIKDDFNLSSTWQELIVSVTVGTAAIFAILGGFANDWIGRRWVIIMASIFFTVGSLAMSIAPNKEILLVGRAIVGMGIGLSSMTIPMFISEVAPIEKRGTLTTLNVAFITGGQFVAACVDGIFANVEEGWRYMLGLAMLPSVLQFIGFMFFLPESPRWYMLKNRFDEAEVTLKQIRGANYNPDEFSELKKDLDTERSNKSFFQALKSSKKFRRALVVGCGLQFFQQLSGINTVMYYSASIMEMSGVRDPAMAIWMAAITAFFNFSFTFVGMWFVERAGRRKLLMISMVGVILSLIFLSAGFYIADHNSASIYSGSGTCSGFDSCSSCQNNKNCGYCYTDPVENTETIQSCLPVNGLVDESGSEFGSLCQNGTMKDGNVWWTESYCPSPYSWMALVGMVCYLLTFAPGMGCMPWVLNAEIYSDETRSYGNSAAATTNWVSNFIVSLTFLTIAEELTTQGAFLLYAGLSVVGLVFFYFCVPETKGIALVRVPDLFEEGLLQTRGFCKVNSLDSYDEVVEFQEKVE